MARSAGVVGAAGFAGIEVVRYLIGHPGFELVYAASDSQAGTKLSAAYPPLATATDLEFSPLDVDVIAQKCEVVFLAVPHTAALAITPELIERGVAVIDLSADYRIHDAAVYEQWYNAEHTSPELLGSAVYGLPEAHREQLASLVDAPVKLVANPGCYPTATALAVMPALRACVQAGPLVISSCLSGVSGAGRKLVRTSSFCSSAESANAYGVAKHRHTPEIAQELSEAAGTDISVVFTPHLIPVKRGMLATVYLQVAPGTTEEQVRALYEEAYADEPFVTMLPAGQNPQISSVDGSNEAQVNIALDTATNTLIAMSAIDNLGKGAAGQAVQNANIIFGYPETDGLKLALKPVV